MGRALVTVGLVVATVAAAAALPAAAGVRAPSCTAGMHAVGGVNARTFCGPASATVTVGGVTYRFKGGECEKGAQYLSLDIGTVVLGQTTKPRPDYVGLNVGKLPLVGGTPAAHDGTFPAEALAIEHAGKSYTMVQATVTLSGGRTRGSFKGKLLTGNGTASGTFRCS